MFPFPRLRISKKVLALGCSSLRNQWHRARTGSGEFSTKYSRMLLITFTTLFVLQFTFNLYAKYISYSVLLRAARLFKRHFLLPRKIYIIVAHHTPRHRPYSSVLQCSRRWPVPHGVARDQRFSENSTVGRLCTVVYRYRRLTMQRSSIALPNLVTLKLIPIPYWTVLLHAKCTWRVRMLRFYSVLWVLNE